MTHARAQTGADLIGGIPKIVPDYVRARRLHVLNRARKARDEVRHWRYWIKRQPYLANRARDADGRDWHERLDIAREELRDLLAEANPRNW